MLKEFWDSLVKQAAQNATPKMVPYNPRDHFAYMDENKVIQFKEPTKGPLRQHQAFSLPSFADYVKQWSEDVKYPQSVWYNRKKVTFFPNDIARDDSCSIRLSPSHQMDLIQNWGKGAAFDNRALWKLLRIDFKGCLADAPRVIEAIKSVNWKKDEEKAGNVDRGKSSLGNKIAAKLEGLEQVPEFISFTVPMFAAHVDVKASIECAIELNELNATFVLIPLPGQVEKAWAEAEYAILHTLTGLGDEPGGLLPKDFPVFYGEP